VRPLWEVTQTASPKGEILKLSKQVVLSVDSLLCSIGSHILYEKASRENTCCHSNGIID
jgi:hypothetical protein